MRILRVTPRRNFLEPVFLQSVAFDDLFPDRALVGHVPDVALLGPSPALLKPVLRINWKVPEHPCNSL